MQISLSIQGRIKLFIFLYLICVTVNSTFGQTLDNSFGINGKVVDKGIFDDYIYVNTAVLHQKNKILIGGCDLDGINFYMFLKRYNPDGNVDGTFAWNGDLPFLSGAAVGGYSAFQRDGSFIFAGTNWDRFSEAEKIVLCSFKPNGEFDKTFGKNGKVIKSVGGFTEIPHAIAVRPAGKILVSGDIEGKDNSGFDNLSLVQYFTDGTVDNTFGASGIIYPTTRYEQFGGAIQILPENKILAAYLYEDNNSFGYRNCLVRYIREGKIDSSFGKNGIVFNNNDNDIGRLFGSNPVELAIQPDGKILEYVNYKNQRMLLRYTTDGKPDNSFGTRGKVILPFQPGEVLSMILQDNGKILINAGPGFAIARYTSNGAPDLSFGKKGILSTSFEYPAISCQKVILQPDGKIIAIGNVDGDGITYLAMARFNNTAADIPKSDDLIAVNQSHSVLLKWQTGTQLDATHFSVERSADNVNFKEIGTVLSKNQLSFDLQYSFVDRSPLAGKNYYRLKEFQSDESFSYSKAVPIIFTKAPQITLTPNPVKNILVINGLNASAKNNLTILRAGGKTLKLRSVSQASYRWDIHDLPAGAYYLVVETNSTRTSLKFIKE